MCTINHEDRDKSCVVMQRQQEYYLKMVTNIENVVIDDVNEGFGSACATESCEEKVFSEMQMMHEEKNLMTHLEKGLVA